MALIAYATAAGIHPDDHMEQRPEPDGGRTLAWQEKGGWIILQWEVKPGQFKQRRITVSRERAHQAMTALDRGKAIA